MKIPRDSIPGFDMRKILATIPRQHLLGTKDAPIRAHVQPGSGRYLRHAQKALDVFGPCVGKRLSDTHTGPRTEAGTRVPLEFRIMEKDKLLAALYREGARPWSITPIVRDGSWLTWNGSIWASTSRRKNVQWAFVHEIWHAALDAFDLRTPSSTPLSQRLPAELRLPPIGAAFPLLELHDSSQEFELAAPLTKILYEHLDRQLAKCGTEQEVGVSCFSRRDP